MSWYNIQTYMLCGSIMFTNSIEQCQCQLYKSAQLTHFLQKG